MGCHPGTVDETTTEASMLKYQNEEGAQVLDYRLHDHYAKWRQLLLVLHREAVGVEKEEREELSEAVGVEKEEREELSADVSVEDKLVWFKNLYHFFPGWHRTPQLGAFSPSRQSHAVSCGLQ